MAVITGSTRGFGLAMAEAYSRAGASVVISSRSAESVQRAVESIRAQGGRDAGFPADVSDLAQVNALASFAHSAFGGLDIWVNNAGLAGTYGPTAHIECQDFVRLVETNILGTYYGSIVAMREFLPRRAGKLINITGRGAREPVPFQNAYASSKSWIRNFTLALAREYNTSGVGVFVLSPGLMTTEMLSEVDVVAGHESRLGALPTVLRMWSKPPHVPAARAVWLASDATDGRTGLDVNTLGPFNLITGALGEGIRRLTGRRREPLEVKLKSIPPAFEDKP